MINHIYDPHRRRSRASQVIIIYIWDIIIISRSIGEALNLEGYAEIIHLCTF